MEKRTMRDYVYLTPSVLRQQLAGQWEEPLAAAFAARPVRILRLVASGSSYNAALCVRPYLRKWLDCEVLVTEPFTFCAYESCLPADELAVVISQSGYSTTRCTRWTPSAPKDVRPSASPRTPAATSGRTQIC